MTDRLLLSVPADTMRTHPTENKKKQTKTKEMNSRRPQEDKKKKNVIVKCWDLMCP